MRISYKHHPPIYIYTGDVYKSTDGEDKYRRVVSVLSGSVYYCNGGDHIHSCLKSTFIRWVRENRSAIHYRINATF